MPAGANNLGLGGRERAWQQEGLCVRQVEFPPQVLLQKPPNGWFRLLPFPRAEEDCG
jgi:hypothetical protein